MANEDLNAGFTGTPTEQPEGVRKMAKTASDVVKRETSAVAAGVAEHPSTATSVVLGIGMLAFAMGYLVGRSSAQSRYRYWRY